MKLNVDDKKIPTGSKLAEWHRKCIKDCFGWTYQEFDEAWKAWAQAAYKPGPPKSGEPSSLPPGMQAPGRAIPGGAGVGG